MPITLPLILLACLSPQEPSSAPTTPPAAPAAAASFSALQPAELEATMRALLKATDEEELALPPIAGAVGPRIDCGVATISRAPGGRLGLLLACGGETFRSGPVETWTPDEVTETLRMDVNGDGQAELVVIASYVSGMEPFQANSVLAWDGKTFRRLEAVEASIRTLTKAAEVRSRFFD